MKTNEDGWKSRKFWYGIVLIIMMTIFLFLGTGGCKIDNWMQFSITIFGISVLGWGADKIITAKKMGQDAKVQIHKFAAISPHLFSDKKEDTPAKKTD